MRRRRGSTLAVVLLTISPLCITHPIAQGTTATLKGVVVDTDGAGLPGVPLTVTSKSLPDSKRTVVTDIEGRFKVHLLSPANDYFLSINYPGFAPIELGPIDLDPGKATVQGITLSSSEQLTQRVDVLAHGSIVDTENTKTSSSFDTEFLEGLPIIGRNYQDVLTLTPGVTDTDGDGNPNVQGARATGLQYRLDGGNITDPASGAYGQNLNLDAIEEIEVITSGASAEYGRADGGFANIITKSGSNDFEGSFKMFWQGRLLNGDGAGENSDTFLLAEHMAPDIRRVSPYLTLGGPILRDRLWYFTSLQYLNRVDAQNLAGASIEEKLTSRNVFAKVTWQADADNRVGLQYNDDPASRAGSYLDFGVEKESDAVRSTGGRTVQLRWTAIVSPVLLLETMLTSYEIGVAITPVSPRFHPFDVTTRVQRNGNEAVMQAVYPAEECVSGRGGAFIPNCDPSRGNPSIHQIDLLSGGISGPFRSRTDDARARRSIRADLTWTLADLLGTHQVKSGLEFADESFEDRPINNPYFKNSWEACADCRLNGAPVPEAVRGFQTLTVPTPNVLHQRAVSFNGGAYVTDSWQPRPGISIQAGLRIDREDIDTSGFTYFNPRTEKRKSIRIVEALCEDAVRVGLGGGDSTASAACRPLTSNYTPSATLRYAQDERTPEWLRRFDYDGDGRYDDGSDGAAWTEPFTAFQDRQAENFEITNLNLSPRFSASSDPGAEGRSKLFATWGRYYDRLFLDTIRFEMGPDTVNYLFEPGAETFTFEPGSISRSASAVSIQQVDRSLKTPSTDVFTLGFEQELAPEWSATITFTQRLSWNLLQDADLNHVRCTDHDDAFGIDPAGLCGLYTDSKGRVRLSDDFFGDPTGIPGANGAPDLYNVSRNYNQVLRIGNFNRSKYRSIAVEIQRRLHRNWQMQASYTLSRSIGDAEEFSSDLGNDPSTADDERGYLDFDQRHRAMLIATTHLPRGIALGTTITWEGGTPYSVAAQLDDADNVGNVMFRTFYPTARRNDQRNGAFWNLDAQIEKRFEAGRVQASAQFAVQNIMNHDDLTLSAFQIASRNGVQLDRGPQGLRRFGRTWEMGVSFSF